LLHPQRTIRTAAYLHIVNFRPDRWPLGEPYRLNSENPLTVQELDYDTRVTLPDVDAGPTKTWMVSQRRRAEWQGHSDWVSALRRREEF
jgi:hypothetical protein